MVQQQAGETAEIEFAAAASTAREAMGTVPEVQNTTSGFPCVPIDSNGCFSYLYCRSVRGCNLIPLHLNG